MSESILNICIRCYYMHILSIESLQVIEVRKVCEMWFFRFLRVFDEESRICRARIQSTSSGRRGLGKSGSGGNKPSSTSHIQVLSPPWKTERRHDQHKLDRLYTNTSDKCRNIREISALREHMYSLSSRILCKDYQKVKVSVLYLMFCIGITELSKNSVEEQVRN